MLIIDYKMKWPIGTDCIGFLLLEGAGDGDWALLRVDNVSEAMNLNIIPSSKFFGMLERE